MRIGCDAGLPTAFRTGPRGPLRKHAGPVFDLPAGVPTPVAILRGL
jgi:hypothetical protein